MLDDLGDICLVLPAHLACGSLGQVEEAAVHPVLPKVTDRVAVGRKVGTNHAEGSVDGPHDEEEDEEVVRVPEALIVCAARLLDGGENNGHQGDKHDVSRPSGSGDQVGEEEADEAQVVRGRETAQVDPVGDGVDPGEEDDGPGDKHVEGDVLVELDNAVQRGSAQQRDEVPADGEEDEGNVEVEDQGSRTRDDESHTKLSARLRHVVF